MKLGILASHPIQYQASWFRALSGMCDLRVYFAHSVTPLDQANAGFGVPFEWDIDLLSGYSSEQLANVARHPDVSTYFGCSAPEVASRIAQFMPDGFIVCGWHLRAYWQAVRACRALGIPVLARGDSVLRPDEGVLRRALRRVTHPRMLRSFDSFLAVGSRFRDYLLHYGVAPDRVFDCPHAVDVDWFSRSAAEARPNLGALRSELGLPRHVPIAVFVGKFVEGKRPADLIAGVAALATQGIRVHPVFAGDGPQRDALAAAAERMNVEASFPGFMNQSRLPALYALADVVVLPSASETWGLVVNEAQACGTRAVVSDGVGCAPDLIVPGLTGETYPVGDIAQLAQAIKRVLDTPFGRDVAERLAQVAQSNSPVNAARGAILAVQEARHRMYAEVCQ